MRNRLPLGEGPVHDVHRPELVVRPVPVVILGAVAGFMVGVTSVGAGSIIIVALLLMYPAIKASSLVGTDLAQAIPLVGGRRRRPPPVRELLAGHRVVAADRRDPRGVARGPCIQAGRLAG